ncbi:hypothetical protein T440DRAFT_260069 [Plenodomus tracheiphilus IPT5]|uniref:Uncharacterized protein n=1 Tax=Plenodomus tracheiphilus IPT5 TaxID=1408161 RepID=A0A6A7ARE1_9PLEO|nr:hypothetical protein T440DRAFT_260069 [Plenodomus tracheiphilus IPT5]
MSQFLDLPIPLPAATLTLGQLISGPLDTDSASLKSTQSFSSKESKHKDAKERTILQTTIDNPLHVFDTLRQDSTTRSFLRKLAYQNNPVYFVTGLQTLNTPTSKPTAENATPTAPEYRLPVRRVDSASNLDITSNSPDNHERKSTESIVAVELRQVKCRIGAPSEPHCIADVCYDWSYYKLDDEDMQLSVGLGKVVRTEDISTIEGMGNREGRNEEKDWRRGASGKVEGLGGF